MNQPRRLRAALLRLPAVGGIAAMKAEPLNVDLPKRKRRWFQFSLRTLLIGGTYRKADIPPESGDLRSADLSQNSRLSVRRFA